MKVSGNREPSLAGAVRRLPGKMAAACYARLAGVFVLAFALAAPASANASVNPELTPQVPAGSTEPFSFAVLGDWGKTYATGNPDQANLMQQIAASGARFVVGAGDTAYPAGSQTSYGDLQQTGPDISAVFGPQY